MLPQEELLLLQKITCDVKIKPLVEFSESTSHNFSNLRIENEFLKIQSCEAVINRDFSVRLENDNLFAWIVEIFYVDIDSKLHEDLQRLKNETGRGIQFRIDFGNNYPLNPPWVTILGPNLECKSNFYKKSNVC